MLVGLGQIWKLKFLTTTVILATLYFFIFRLKTITLFFFFSINLLRCPTAGQSPIWTYTTGLASHCARPGVHRDTITVQYVNQIKKQSLDKSSITFYFTMIIFILIPKRLSKYLYYLYMSNIFQKNLFEYFTLSTRVPILFYEI